MKRLLWLLLALAVAQGATADHHEKEEVPEAIRLLRSAAGPLQSATGIRVKTRVTYDVVQEDGRKLEFGSFDESVIRRPNRARATFESDNGSVRHLFYDGETLTTHFPEEKVYGQFPVKNNLDDTFDYVEVDLGIPLPLADLFYSDLSHLGSRATEADVVGESRVIGWVCDQLSFVSEDVDYQVWVERGDTPLIRKLVMTYKARPSSPQFRAVFLEWDLNAITTDQEFVFEPGPDTERIPTLAQPLRFQEVE